MECYCEHALDEFPFYRAHFNFSAKYFQAGRSLLTLKVHLAAISACHVGWSGMMPVSHPLASCFLKGAIRPPGSVGVPPWDLVLVLRAFTGPPFEPMEGVQLKWLSYKEALLLALMSVR